MLVKVFSLLVTMGTAMPQNFDSHRTGFGSFGTITGVGAGRQTTRVGHSISGFGNSVSDSSLSAYTNCERREVSPGYYEYDCLNAHPGEIVDEKVLWVPYSGSDQNLLIRVPNYGVKEIVRAATYSEGENSENIRVHVARPHVEHVVEGQFEKQAQHAPNVQLSYEPLVQHHEKVYGPPGEPFRPLTKRIDDQVGLRRTSTFGNSRPASISTTGFGTTGFGSTGFGTTGFGATGFGTTGFSSRSGPTQTVFSNNRGSNSNLNTGFSSSFTNGNKIGRAHV